MTPEQKCDLKRWMSGWIHPKFMDAIISKIDEAYKEGQKDAPKWIIIDVQNSQNLPEFGYEVVARFNKTTADMGYFQVFTDPECGEESIYFQSNDENIGRTFIRGLYVEWLDEGGNK